MSGIRSAVLFCLASCLGAQVSPVLTRSNGNLRHGAYQESIINPQNVGRLHRLYSLAIPNDARGIESQPLILPHVPIESDGNKPHDLLVLSTLANDVLGYDLHTGSLLWRIGLGQPVKVNRSIDFWGINDHVGVLSTGVIDPDTQTWYGVAWSSPDGSPGKGWHSLHAIDLKSGKEHLTPLSMNGLTYDNGHGLTVHYAGQMRKQRSALTLATVGGRKTLFFGSGSVLEANQGASGWVTAADVASWRYTATWAATSRYFGGGIWMAGQGLAVDPAGFLYCITGNGSFDGVTEFGESFVKLRYSPPANNSAAGKLEAVNWWAPWSDSGRIGQDPTAISPRSFNGRQTGKSKSTENGYLVEPVNKDHMMHTIIAHSAANDAYGDQDLGSGSIILLPQLDYLGGAGKDGIWYTVRLSNMGKTVPADFAHPAANYAKLLSPPFWYTYPAFQHNGAGQVIGYEKAAPDDATQLNFAYDNKTHHMHSTPAVLENSPLGILNFCWGENGNLRAWRINPNGSMTFLANSQEVASPDAPANPGGMPGGMLAVSSNYGKDAILWAIVPYGDANRQITGGVLYAYDAQNFGKFPDGSGWIKLLWRSTSMFAHPKFNTPVISGGYVVLPTFSGSVDVLGIN